MGKRSYLARFVLTKDGESGSYVYQPAKDGEGRPIFRVHKEGARGEVLETYEIREQGGEVVCTCPGFRTKERQGGRARCKHYDALVHFGGHAEDLMLQIFQGQKA